MIRTPLTRRTPLRARHHTRRGQHAAHQTVQDRSHGRCEVRSPVCTGQAVHVHHVLLRAHTAIDDPRLMVDTCAACHAWIHGHVAESYQRGWLMHPWDAK